MAVAYEQHIGRRVAGQRSDGTFEVSVSKTLDGTREEVFAKVAERFNDVTEFDGKTAQNIRTSETPVRSYRRCNLSDGSKLTVAVEQKSPGKVLLVVTHGALQSTEEGDAWRGFWKTYIGELA